MHGRKQFSMTQGEGGVELLLQSTIFEVGVLESIFTQVAILVQLVWCYMAFIYLLYSAKLIVSGNEAKTTPFIVLYGFWFGSTICLTPLHRRGLQN